MKWYWFLEPEVALSIGLLCLMVVVLLVTDYAWAVVLSMFAMVIAVVIAGEQRDRISMRHGVDRVLPPKNFKLFWRCVLLAEFVAYAVLSGRVH